MKFTHRLGYYFGGLAIGLIFLAFFLRKKSDATGTSFCYLPNCRVLKELRVHPVSYSAEFMNDLFVANQDTSLLARVLLKGDIDFGSSIPRGEPCKIFYIDHQEGDNDFTTEVQLCDSVLVAKRILLKPKTK